MKKLEQLPEITEKALGGLEAGQSLKYRILNEARRPAQRVSAWRIAVPALACAVVVAVASFTLLPSMRKSTVPNAGIVTFSAGSATEAPALIADNGIGGGSITQKNTAASPNSIWEKSSQLICVNGRWYRMLKGTVSKSGSALGTSVGQVTEKVSDPALASSDHILSSVCEAGTEVYAVKGMENTLVAAEVNGKTRLFQRVAFNGSAVVGRESLSDTLQISGHVKSITLSDVGTVSNASKAEALVSTLLANASYESSAVLSGSRYLQITLDNGATIQLIVKNNSVSACGTWSCPDFFSAFEQAVR